MPEPPEIISQIVDARGLLCPQPMVLARLALDALLPGERIAVWVTDPLAPLDLEALCVRLGHAYRGQQALADGVQVVSIEKRSEGGDPQSNARMRSRI